MDTKHKTPQTFSFEREPLKMSAHQPINITPEDNLGREYILNGPNNVNFKTIRDAYDDSPTNQSIINAYVNYIFGEGLVNVSTISDINLQKYISDDDALLICQDYKMIGGYALQVIWNDSVKDKKPLKLKYIPIDKLGVNYIKEKEIIDGYWYSYDWTKQYTYRPKFYPKFTGSYKGYELEILYVMRPHKEQFFPVPDYISGIPWARIEGELANAGYNHFKNAMSDITVINYNQGRQATTELAQIEADKVRNKVVGTDNQSSVIVSFNDGVEEAVVVDRVSPPELNQQNVFYSEEAERKLIVAHSAPPILFSGTNAGSGFSSNADEIEVATNALYRRNINPMRKGILTPLQSVFKLIDITIKPDFKDFEEEKLEGPDVVKKEIIEKPTLMQKLFKK